MGGAFKSTKKTSYSFSGTLPLRQVLNALLRRGKPHYSGVGEHPNAESRVYLGLHGGVNNGDVSNLINPLIKVMKFPQTVISIISTSCTNLNKNYLAHDLQRNAYIELQ